MPHPLRTTLIAGLLAGASAAAIAMPPDGAGPRSEHAERAIARLADRFDITETQRAEIAQIRTSYGARLAEQRDDRRALVEAERALDPAAADYVASAQALAEQRARLSVQQATLRAEQRHLIAGVLTVEQRAAMAEARARHAEHRGAGRFKDHGPGRAGRGDCRSARTAG